METIITYVNNIFSSLPATPEIAKTKEEITNHMLEKYHELKADGKSENEAIGIVISEFGNVDELLQEFGINYNNETQTSSLSFDTIKEYLHIKNLTGILITVGVALCIFGVLLALLFEALADQSIFTLFLDSSGDSIFAIASLLICVAIAVGLFIYSSYLAKPYEYIEKGAFIDIATKEYILEKKEKESKAHTLCIIFGVILCILSPVTYCIFEYFLGKNNDLAGIPMISLILIAVSLFVYSGCRNSVYDILLKEPRQYAEDEEAHSLGSTINSVIMLTATGIYLICGFFYDNWGTSVYVFAIGAILCAISSTITNYLRRNK